MHPDASPENKYESADTIVHEMVHCVETMMAYIYKYDPSKIRPELRSDARRIMEMRQNNGYISSRFSTLCRNQAAEETPFTVGYAIQRRLQERLANHNFILTLQGGQPCHVLRSESQSYRLNA